MADRTDETEVARLRALIDSMIVECGQGLPAKAIWLATRNGDFEPPADFVAPLQDQYAQLGEQYIREAPVVTVGGRVAVQLFAGWLDERGAR